jgi:N-acylneuraminate cytidylyltransferase
MGDVAAVIPARGGSKGIPGKNLVEFCGRPLLVWSIEQALAVDGIASVWVSSESEPILAAAEAAGAETIERPREISADDASSEAAWLHAIDVLEEGGVELDLVVGMQATSPLREPSDLARALDDVAAQGCDSLFSAAALDDFYIWSRSADGAFDSMNYDWRNRGRRQEFGTQYVENGSFYVFRPGGIRETGNRLNGRIGVTEMELWKSFEIDTPEDLDLCETLMRHYLGGTADG